MGSTAEHAFNIYRGTFIQLSRLPASGAKPELCRDQGALWVSTADGRIKGWDWQARDEHSFAELMSRNGWVDLDAIEATGNSHAAGTKVKVTTADEGRNEFFFPGFIGKFVVSSYPLEPTLTPISANNTD
jgi:guanine deaminase